MSDAERTSVWKLTITASTEQTSANPKASPPVEARTPCRCCARLALIRSLLLLEQLVQEIFQHVVAERTGIGIGLAVRVENGGRRLADGKGHPDGFVFINEWLEFLGIHDGLDLFHFRGGENPGDRALHVAAGFPLVLILKQGRFDGLALPDVR